MPLSDALAAVADTSGIDLGMKNTHSMDFVSEVVIRYTLGLPVKVMVFRHVADGDTGEEMKRLPGTTIRTGDSLDADEILKTVVAALAPIGDRLKLEDDMAKIAADNARKAAEIAVADNLAVDQS